MLHNAVTTGAAGAGAGAGYVAGSRYLPKLMASSKLLSKIPAGRRALVAGLASALLGGGVSGLAGHSISRPTPTFWDKVKDTFGML